MIIKKVNIDQLMDLLLKYRQTGEWVDMRVDDNTNTITISPNDTLIIEPHITNRNTDLNSNNLNQLIV